MLQFFQKSLFRPQRRSRSQIAVIITFVLALLVILAVILINLSRLSDMKTLTSQVSDKAGLTLASQLGSYGKLLKDHEIDNTEALLAGVLLAIVVTCAVSIIAIVTFGWGLVAAAALGVSGGLLSGAWSLLHLQAWNGAASQMTLYSSLREGVLNEMLTSLQGDTEEVVRDNPSTGIFHTKDNLYTYDLTDTSLNYTLKGRTKTGRFSAWYFSKRFPRVDDGALRLAVDNFTRTAAATVIPGGVDEWEESTWKYKWLSWPLRLESGVITGSGPAWVLDGSTIRAGTDWDKNDVITTFLKWLSKDLPPDRPTLFEIGSLVGMERFFQLNSDYLDAAGGQDFCSDAWPHGWGVCGKYLSQEITEDLRATLQAIKLLMNNSISTRIQTVFLWKGDFYDKSFSHSASGGGHDVYDRLNRLDHDITKLINGFNNVNTNKVEPDIVAGRDIYNNPTFCEQGRGGVQHECFTQLEECEYCCAWKCTPTGCHCIKWCKDQQCITPMPARWYGDYGTCPGDNDWEVNHDYNHSPACGNVQTPVGAEFPFNGDLFYTRPAWCGDTRAPVDCKTKITKCSGNSCQPPPSHYTMHPSYNFQGNFGWDSTSLPTSVDQAVTVLTALREEVRELRCQVLAFSTVVDTYLAERETSPHYNTIDYAWEDSTKSKEAGRQHFVRVKISDYPKYAAFPQMKTETLNILNVAIPFITLKVTAVNLNGGFSLSASRYDSDISFPWWNMRTRKKTSDTAYSREQLTAIINAVHTTGNTDAVAGAAQTLDDTYAVRSATEARYGPQKSDITITRKE